MIIIGIIKSLKYVIGGIMLVAGLIWGVIVSHNPFIHHAPNIACVAIDPPDESPGLDFDSHNCPGVK